MRSRVGVDPRVKCENQRVELVDSHNIINFTFGRESSETVKPCFPSDAFPILFSPSISSPTGIRST